MANCDNKARRAKRHMRIRKKISGTAERPRFCVSVTANNIYCQFIDDEAGKTLAAGALALCWVMLMLLLKVYSSVVDRKVRTAVRVLLASMFSYAVKVTTASVFPFLGDTLSQ